MKPTRRTKLSRLLHEILSDEGEDRGAIAAELRLWAERLEARAGAWERPDRGGRPRASNFVEDDADPTFLPALFAHFASLMTQARPLARRARNPVTFRDRLPPGKDLLGPFPSGGPDFPEMFRRRFADLASDTSSPPKVAAARLVLWYGQAGDSTEEAERLLERLKKRGKPRPK